MTDKLHGAVSPGGAGSARGGDVTQPRAAGISYTECKQKPCGMPTLVGRDADPGQGARAICPRCGGRFRFVGFEAGVPAWRSIG